MQKTGNKDYLQIGTFSTQKSAATLKISEDDTRLYVGDYNDGFEVISVELP